VGRSQSWGNHGFRNSSSSKKQSGFQPTIEPTGFQPVVLQLGIIAAVAGKPSFCDRAAPPTELGRVRQGKPSRPPAVSLRRPKLPIDDHPAALDRMTTDALLPNCKPVLIPRHAVSLPNRHRVVERHENAD
jgi:hypothetical protein